MKKMMMIGAALAALMGPAKADVYACRHLFEKLDMHTTAGQQAKEAFENFVSRYGLDTVANDPQLMATAKRLAGKSQQEAATFADLSEMVVSSGCVSANDAPKFRQWANQVRAVANGLAETLR